MGWNPLTWFGSSASATVASIVAETEALYTQVESIKSKASGLVETLTTERGKVSSKYSNKLSSLKQMYDMQVASATSKYNADTEDVDEKLSALSDALSTVNAVAESIK